MTPLFTILLPAYKRRYLQACIESVLAQTYPDFELVIVNDASPEDIESVVRLFNDPRIRYYRNEKNTGAKELVRQWNYCLSLAKGDYVICMGDDDKLMPDCLETYRKYIVQYPDVAVLHGQTDIIGPDDRLLCHTTKRPEWESAISLLYHRTFAYDHQFIGDFCYKRKQLVENGGFYYMPYAWGSDDISAIIAAKESGIVNTPNVVFQYRDNNASITRTPHSFGKIRAVLLEAIWKNNFLKTPAKDATDEEYRKTLRRNLLWHTFKKCYNISYNNLLFTIKSIKHV